MNICIKSCWILYMVYQNEVNSSQNDPELKRIKYLVNFLFLLDKSTSCLPPVEKSLLCDNH